MKNLFTKKLPFVIFFILFILGGIDGNAKVGFIGVSPDNTYAFESVLFKHAGLTDISLSQTTSTGTITYGGNITFTLTVNNEGQNNVTGLIVTDILPVGATLVSATPSVGMTSVSSNILTWQVGTIIGNTSLPTTLTIVLNINNSGVFYNAAEITAMNELDIDSTPNNQNLNEDDIATACTSVPYRYCVGEPIELQASASAGYSNYQWYKDGVLIAGATTSNYTITSIGSYTFTADVSNGTSSCSGSLCCPIVVENYPSLSINATPIQPSCETTNKGIITASVSGGFSPFLYNLNNGVFQSNNIFNGLSTGNYIVAVKDNNGCTANTNTIQIEQATPPNAPVVSSDKTNICGTEVAILTASSCTGVITWSNGSTQNPISVNASGNYIATCTNACGTSVTSNVIQINKGAAPNAPVVSSDKTNICGTEVAILTASSCTGVITWSNGSTQNPISVNASENYIATCTNACGTSVTSNVIQINKGAAPNAPVVSSDKTNICGTEVAILTANNCTGVITWSNGSTQNPISINASGNYSATCTNACGTSVTSNVIQINKGAAPNAPVVSSDKTNICGTEVAILTASNCTGVITWSNGSTQNPISINASGNYSATCTNACGTSVTSNVIQINKGAAPNAPVVSSDKTNICGSEVAILTASNCTGVITWSNGSTQNPISINASGNYSATCTNACGTSVTSNVIQINKGAAPNAPVVSSDKTNICGTEVAILTASSCTGVITWSNGSTQNPISVNASGNYSATCTNACGTSITSNVIQINKGAAPNAPVVSSDKTNICGTEVAILTANNCTGVITWSNGSTQNPINVSTSGNYSATCTNACGTSITSNVIQINKGAAPNAPVVSSDKTNICGTEVAILTANNCTGVITWSNGSTQNPISINASGNYSATCTNACGVSVVSNVIQINKGVAPNAPVVSSDKTNICGTEVAILTASSCTGVITWSNGSTQNPISVNASGNYSATCTNACGTSVTSNVIQINKRAAPNAPVVSSDKTNICGTEVAILTANNCTGVITWSNGSTQKPISVNASGNYSATCTNACGVSVVSNVIQINKGAAPNAPVVSSDKTNICGTEVAILTTSNCTGVITWSNGSTQNPISVNASGNYSATCTNTCGVSVVSNVIQINKGAAPNAPVVSSDKTNICGTEVAILTANNCTGVITWSNGSTQNPISVNASGNYSATCTSACGVSVISNVIQINKGAAPNTPEFSIDKTICCDGSYANLTASCIGTVLWSSGETTPTIKAFKSGIYTVRCTNACGSAEASKSITIITVPPPMTPIITSNKPSLCENEEASLTAIGCNGSVLWSTGTTGTIVSINKTGIYTAKCLNICGESNVSNELIISTSNKPTAPVISSNKTSLCNSETATLSATGCSGNIKWSIGATTGTINVSTSGTYTATCSNSCGESGASNVLVINTGTSPTAPIISSNKTSLCNSETATLSATGCVGSIKWSTGATTGTINVSTSGTYTATCSNRCGESGASNVLVINTGTSPTAPIISSNKTSLCNSETATLSATGCAGSIKWNTNATGSSINVSTSGTYTATCSNSCGESGISNVLVISTGTSPIAPVISSTKTSLCNSEIATLSATVCSGNIKWNTNATGSSIIVSTSGTYTATCSNSCGESGISNALVISTGTSPTAAIINSTKTSLCNSETSTLSATGCAGSIKWSTTATGSTISVSTAGTYTATCSNSCGESGASNIVVITTGNSPAAPVISSNKNSLCNAETATLSATSCTGNIKWSTTATGSTISVSTAGTYTATCSNSCGESGASNIVVITTGNSPAAPVISSNKNSLCNAETATLSATGCAGSIKWSTTATGSTISTISVSTAGKYTATCSNSCGESGASNIVVITTGNSPAAPVISSNKNSLCNAETATLSATSCTGNIKWSTTATGSTISVSTAGTYTATCNNSCGESGASNTLVISTGTSPAAPVISSTKKSLCNSETATLSATSCVGSIKWSTGATTGTINVSTSGTYTATCSNSCDESGISNALVISTGTSPTAPIINSNKTSLCNSETATLSTTGCVGSIKWSTGATTGTINVNTSGTYTATCSNVCGESGASNVLVISSGTSPTAPVISSTKTSLCNSETATLTATGCAGSIKWSTNATGTSVIVSTSGTYTATCSNVCGESGASNALVISTGTSPTAPVISSTKTSLCNSETATLSATGCSGNIKWSTGATTGTIIVSTSGTYTATCSNSCGESGVSNVLVTSTGNSPSSPVLTADKQSVCSSEEVNLTASGCDGQIVWSTSQTGTSIKVKPLTSTTYSTKCIKDGGCESLSSTIAITVKSNGGNLVVTGPTEVCEGDLITLKASGCNELITWSNGATGSSITVTATTPKTYIAKCVSSNQTICDFSEGNITLKAVGGSTGASINTRYLLLDSNGKILKINLLPTFTSVLSGNYIVSAVVYSSTIDGLVVGNNISTVTSTCMARTNINLSVCNTTLSECIPTGQIAITVKTKPSSPSIIADKTTICNAEEAQLTATGCNGNVQWNNGSTGTQITVSTIGTYTATCKNECGVSAVSNAIVISTTCGGCKATTPVISASKTNICKPENVTLTSTSCEGTIVWSTGQTGASITVKPVTTSTYTAVCKVSNTCISAVSNTVQVKIGAVEPPVLACSTNLVCVGESTTLKAYGCEGVVIWSNGSIGGIISITPDGFTTYTAKCKVGDCESISSEHVAIPIGRPNQPFVSCQSSVLCLGGEATLTASGCTGTIVWSDGQTGAVIKVSPIIEKTVYSAICKSIGGQCESAKSNEVTVTVGKKVVSPKVISEISNVCPYNTADLNTAILSEPSTEGGQFEFHTTSSANSPLVTNPSAVGAGIYYIFERSAVGCYCDFASIKVTTKACEGGGIDPSEGLVDVSVKKVASSKVVPVNELVSYKLVIKNVSQNTATGIIVRDILPNTLSYESASSNVTFANGVITAKIESLKAGDSTTITYTTKVMAAGKIVNKAELLKVNETDNVLSNNSSEYTINDPSQSKTIGISKVCEPAIWVKDRIYNVPFVIYVTNLGGVDATKIQVKDDLDRAFGSGAKILNDTIKIFTDSGLVANPLYTGRGTNTNMLIDSLSSIKQGQKLTLRFTVKVDLANATVSDFFNVAEVSSAGKVDISTNGANADPDGDGDPSNNDEPTPIQFKLDISPDRPAIGVALSVYDTTKINKNCYKVTYMALVKNIGNSKLTNVQVIDSLAKAYSKSSSFQMVGSPNIGMNSTLKVNPNFNGKDDVNLLIADSTSKLEVGRVDTVFYTISVCNGDFREYATNAYAKAIGHGKVVTDISNAGVEINVNDNTPTVIEFPSNVSDLFIPSGFSPNGDGKNDTFIISIPLGAKVELFEIYNRWGQLVYKDTTGAITASGWDGKSNQGLRLGSEGLPDGTYYYALKLSNEKMQRIHFMTLAR